MAPENLQLVSKNQPNPQNLELVPKPPTLTPKPPTQSPRPFNWPHTHQLGPKEPSSGPRNTNLDPKHPQLVPETPTGPLKPPLAPNSHQLGPRNPQTLPDSPPDLPPSTCGRGRPPLLPPPVRPPPPHLAPWAAGPLGPHCRPPQSAGGVVQSRPPGGPGWLWGHPAASSPSPAASPGGNTIWGGGVSKAVTSP